MRALIAEVGCGALLEVLREGIGVEMGTDLVAVVDRVCHLPASQVIPEGDVDVRA